jgi:hypothetical protein
MIEELDDQDESPYMNMSETGEEVQDESLAFDDNLNFDADNIEMEEGDQVFMVMVHLVDPQHFIHASSIVSGRLAEAFAKNSMPKGFHDTVPTALRLWAYIYYREAIHIAMTYAHSIIGE